MTNLSTQFVIIQTFLIANPVIPKYKKNQKVAKVCLGLHLLIVYLTAKIKFVSLSYEFDRGNRQ
jgi:hypothetical protein